MITETGRVVAVDQQSLWVETINQSACGSCSAEQGCGQSLLAKWSARQQYLQVMLGDRDSRSIAVNDTVTIGIPDDVVVKSALLLYCLPLLFLVVGAVVGDAWVAGDVGSVVGGLSGLLVGGVFVTYCTRSLKKLKRYQPVLLETIPVAHHSAI